MIFKIKKGRHKAKPLTLGFFINPKAQRRAVIFHKDCRYKIEGEDMADTNKLFGIGYFFNHHRDSARFGWRYDPGTDLIIISAYCYINGVRDIRELCGVPVEEKIIYNIYFDELFYKFSVLYNGETIATEHVPRHHKKIFAFPLGFYFGGNKPAPQNISIESKKI